jgi:site-specific DNA-methyltransferase (adenine-specific)
VSIYYQDDAVTIHHGDCVDVLRTLPDYSVDAVVTDPPYNLTAGKRGGTGVASVNLDSPYGRARIGTGNGSGGFMGQHWDDYDSHIGGFQGWCEEWATECLRVLKPGGHLLAFGGSRTWHRLACAVEDAGFEIRDSIAWLYGSGFPKSLDVSKAIDKHLGVERRDLYADKPGVDDNEVYGVGLGVSVIERRPATDEPRRWQGFGTAMKPAFEPIVVARKPLSGTIAATVLAHGTGALNIDGCRIDTNGEQLHASTVPNDMRGGHYGSGHRPGEPSAQRRYTEHGGTNFAATPGPRGGDPAGRWPANVVLDESQAAELDAQSGVLTSGKMQPTHTDANREVFGQNASGGYTTMETYGDTGGASRFFYVAKAASSERVRVNGVAHPTVKPLELMRWLVRLITPPGGTVLEPFAGSGTTVEACLLEGMRCIAIEREADYLPLIRQRIDRRRDPVAAVRGAGEDGGLFDLLEEGA